MGATFQGEIVEMWRTQDSSNYYYFEQVEKLTDAFWAEGTAFRTLFDRLDLSRVVEIACGQGRHTVRVPRRYESLLAVDTSIDAISECRKRYGDLANVRFEISNDGQSIPAPPESQTALFSYDAMVHFEPLTMAAYLAESARVLVQGGRGLFHHSNYSANPTGKFTEGLHWRNYMTRDLFAHFCSRNGLKVLERIEIDWNEAPKLDCLTLLERV